MDIPISAVGRKMRRSIGLLPKIALFGLLSLLILSPARYSAACMNGILLWARAVLPALFPFFILTGMLARLGAGDSLSKKAAPLMRRLKMPPSAAYCFFLSALSGYPLGSRIVASMYEEKKISAGEAKRMSVLCSTSGPMFILGSVGSAMFRDVSAGAILLLSHLSAVLLICLCFVPFLKPLPDAGFRLTPTRNTNNLFYETVRESVLSILSVGGCIAAFSVLLQALDDLNLFSLAENLFSFPNAPTGAGEVVSSFLRGCIEATNGCALLSETQTILTLPLTAFIITLGGLCILSQQLGYLKKANVSALFFIAFKFLQAAAAFAICLLLCLLFR